MPVEPRRSAKNRWKMERKPRRKAGVMREMPSSRNIWEEKRKAEFLKSGESSATLYRA